MPHTVFIEIGPLQELRYTGVAMVTLGLCRYWLKREPDSCRFFIGPYLIGRRAVEVTLESRGGALLQTLMTEGHAITDLVQNEIRRCPCPVALFPSVKSSDAAFRHSFQIVHDLSFLLNPEFHDADTIRYHGLTIVRDLSSNDRTFCVSEATANDIGTYLGVPRDKITVVYPGADTPWDTDTRPAEAVRTGARFLPYVVVPGTIEPRKNIDLVLQTLSGHRELLRQHRWLFFGDAGWRISFADRIERHGLGEDWAAGAIRWLGYVDENAKALLYRHADLTVYPSLFEGFGIPVVEAMRQGCPVVCSHSSGIPEAGGDAAFYFDPTSEADFIAALKAAFDRCARNRAAVRETCRNHAANFTWDRFARTIDEAIAQTVAAAE